MWFRKRTLAIFESKGGPWIRAAVVFVNQRLTAGMT